MNDSPALKRRRRRLISGFLVFGSFVLLLVVPPVVRFVENVFRAYELVTLEYPEVPPNATPTLLAASRHETSETLAAVIEAFSGPQDSDPRWTSVGTRKLAVDSNLPPDLYGVVSIEFGSIYDGWGSRASIPLSVDIELYNSGPQQAKGLVGNHDLVLLAPHGQVVVAEGGPRYTSVGPDTPIFSGDVETRWFVKAIEAGDIRGRLGPIEFRVLEEHSNVLWEFWAYLRPGTSIWERVPDDESPE